MKRKREVFVKVLEKKLSWFLLISGLSLILACQSWSQIRISGLERDNIYIYIVIWELAKSQVWVHCPVALDVGSKVWKIVQID